MKFLISVFLLIGAVSDSKGDTRKWLASDFFIEGAPSALSLRSSRERGPFDPVACRNRITKLMCLVDPEAPGATGKPRPCLPGGEAYADTFKTLYSLQPKFLKRVFCSLEKIYVERQFFGSAYAGFEKESSGKSIAILGIRKSLIDTKLSLATWASWKEQLSFGGDPKTYSPRPGLPLVYTRTDLPADYQLLYFLIAHEFGHILDFANHLNRCEKSEDDIDKCKMAPGSWGALSWKAANQPLDENEFSDRTGLCFYDCKKTLPASAAKKLYAELYHKTNFLSTYATTEPWDDFADSLAYYTLGNYVLEENPKMYWLSPEPRVSYDIFRKLYSKRFHSKYRFIRDFLKNPAIVYP